MDILQVINGWFPGKVNISIAGNCGLEKKIGRFAFGNMIGVVSECFKCAIFERNPYAEQHENRQRRLEGIFQ